ncbi:MAG: hypothetical protein ACOC7U_00480 [Spirochaetota bacterium]
MNSIISHVKGLDMPLFFYIDDKLNFTTEVILTPEFLQMNIAEVLNNITGTGAKIKKTYAVLVAGGGKIRGQERTMLVEGLDRLFMLILTLRSKLGQNLPRQILSNINLNFRVSWDLKHHNKYTAQGRLEPPDLFGIESFNKGYQYLVLNNIKELLVKYKEFLADENVDVEKAEALYRGLDDIFYDIMVVRYNVHNLLIDT